MIIYRSEDPGKKLNSINPCRKTLRLPGNVPFVIDNLWEWKRPEGFPCRRHSVYASPIPELAKKLGREEGQVYRIKICGNYMLAQVKKHKDSKYHPECHSLNKALQKKLGMSGRNANWVNKSLADKTTIGRLWMPGLSKEQVEELFTDVIQLSEIKSEIYEMIKYWDNVMLIRQENICDPQGELFFESDVGYVLSENVYIPITHKGADDNGVS
jgi:hypothetical protein